MGTKKVIVYYMHEDEEAECGRRMTNAVSGSGYSFGTMHETDIAALEELGILVEEIADPEEQTTAARGPVFMTAATPAPGRVAFVGEPQDAVLHPGKDNVFCITIDGPFLLPAWLDELKRANADVIERLPDGRYTAYLSLAQVREIQKFPFVSSVRLFAPEDSAGTVFTMLAAGAVRADAAPTDITYDLLLHRAEDMEDVLEWLAAEGIKILARGNRKFRISLPSNSPLVRRIEALPEVRQVAQYVEPTLANEVARRLLGLEPPSNPGVQPLAQTGSGEIVAVADSGLDHTHPDFQGRIVAKVARGRPGNSSDPHGHGTHVAGSVLGDGAASNGAHKGTAPGASLFFQSIMDGNGRLGGLPVDLGELFEQAYAAGARIHNNSWSADTKAFYTFSALEVDEFVETHPDMLITIAAGNEATAANPFNVNAGFVDWQSIGSPATAKNALTVGASCNERMTGGFAGRSWNSFNAIRFPDPPIASAVISKDPECLAAFSARGPCDPRRIKPDVVAPGTDILSTRASTAPNSSFWGLLPGNDRYAYLGGTSMATPLVSGCAALVRQYYREQRQHTTPSAALVKATLINSTKQLSGPDALADHQDLPNYHQGFGAIYMPYALPNSAKPWIKLEFVDTATTGGGFVVGGHGRTRLAFDVHGGEFLRVCLTWTDPAAGSSLLNILGVLLEHSELEPPKRMGNQNRQNPLGRLDRDNNVQIIRVEENPPPGSYLLQIFAANLVKSQEWSLVVTGDIGPLTEV